MVFFGGLLGVLALGVWLFCIIDVVTTPRDQVRTLPKLAWIAIVILLIDVGSLAWLLAGRPWNARAMTPRGADRTGSARLGTSAALPRRAPARRPLSPDDDEEFLAELARRNAEDKRRGDGPEPA